MTQFAIPMPDGLDLTCLCDAPAAPKAVVLLIHGAKEYKERYVDFARFLQENGYAWYVADNRGHGQSVNEAYPLGHFDSAQHLVDDLQYLLARIHADYPTLPLYLFGHSLGSCLARRLLQQDDTRFAKVALTGTVAPIPLAKGLAACLQKHCSAKSATSRRHILVKIGDNPFNGWVCADKERLRLYRADPMCCGYRYTKSAILGVVESAGMLRTRYRAASSALPIASFVGRKDPITGFGLGLASSRRMLRRAGYTDVRTRRYAGMKHEVLNERDNAQVYRDILAFFEE